VTAWASTQGISSVRDGLAGGLQLDQSKVRVITEYMGGGFGAKFGPGVEGVLAAKLSREAKAPVRLMLTCCGPQCRRRKCRFCAVLVS
jgi:xanthine dehydrogenase YagR molybdenum-binding subunit